MTIQLNTLNRNSELSSEPIGHNMVYKVRNRTSILIHDRVSIIMIFVMIIR